MKTNNTDFQTPEWVCDYMTSLVYRTQGTILEPTPGKGNLTKSIKKHHPNASIITPDGDFLDMPIRKVSAVIANPPFTPMSKGYKMLNRFFEFSGSVVVLMPWLTVINSEKRLNCLKEPGLFKIVHLPRRVFKGSRVQTCILVFGEDHSGEIMFVDINDEVNL